MNVNVKLIMNIYIVGGAGYAGMWQWLGATERAYL